MSLPLPPDDNTELAAHDERPSKSSRKRAAHDAQKLGERLVTLREAQLAALDLPETLAEAIRAARTIRTHGGLARQRQLIGKLMRQVDPEPIWHALEAESRTAAADAERFRRTEAWRDRLVREGEPAIATLAEWSGDLDRAALARLVARSRDPAAAASDRAAAGRELFRYLRELFSTPGAG